MSDDATLPDALQTLAEDLQGLIAECLTDGKLTEAAQLRRAKFDLENAAGDIDAGNLTALFNGNAGLEKIRSLTNEIATKAAAIASQEKNVARIVGIAAGVVNIAANVATGNISGILGAADDVAKIID